MEVHVSRSSAVVLQHVPVERAEWFMEWQRGVSEAASTFAGYRGTDIYPPSDSQRDEWVVILHFDDEKLLQEWLDSPVRSQWVEKLETQVGKFMLKPLPGGFASWFAGLESCREGPPPPSWKMALTVLFGLYPTVMLLTLFPGPYTEPLGLALAMLIGNALSVCILQWGVMPVLNTLVAPWLQANSDKQRIFSIGGALMILVILVSLALLFRLVTG